MACYVIHFDQPYKHAAHYTGFAEDVEPRFNAHLHGRGARLTQVVREAGIGMILARVWPDGDRKLERKLKNRHGTRVCPICLGEPVQLPLLAWMPAYQPDEDDSSADDEQDGPPAPDAPSLFDLELEDLQEGIADEDFWRSGAW